MSFDSDNPPDDYFGVELSNIGSSDQTRFVEKMQTYGRHLEDENNTIKEDNNNKNAVNEKLENEHKIMNEKLRERKDDLTESQIKIVHLE